MHIKHPRILFHSSSIRLPFVSPRPFIIPIALIEDPLEGVLDIPVDHQPQEHQNHHNSSYDTLICDIHDFPFTDYRLSFTVYRFSFTEVTDFLSQFADYLPQITDFLSQVTDFQIVDKYFLYYYLFLVGQLIFV